MSESKPIQRLDWEAVHSEYTKLQEEITGNKDIMKELNASINHHANSIMQIATHMVAKGAAGVVIQGNVDIDGQSTLYAAYVCGISAFVGSHQKFEKVSDGVNYIGVNYIDTNKDELQISDNLERDMKSARQFVAFHFGEIMTDFAHVHEKIERHPMLVKILESFASGSIMGLAITRAQNSGSYVGSSVLDEFYMYCLSLYSLIKDEDDGDESGRENSEG